MRSNVLSCKEVKGMKLYMRYLAIHIKSAMQYKASFCMMAAGQFISAFTAFLAIAFMFARFHTVDDFTFSEVLLCYAISTMSFALAECFGRGFDLFPQVISNGEFDRILVRPRSPMFQVLSAKMELSRIGRLFQAILILCYALPASAINWTGAKLLTLLLMILGGTALFFGLFILYATFTFFTIEGLEVLNIFTYGGQEFSQYPVSIYGDGVLKFLTYVIPIACVQYYPLLFLLDRTQSAAAAFFPLAAFAFLGVCAFAWRFGVKRFQSTGS